MTSPHRTDSSLNAPGSRPVRFGSSLLWALAVAVLVVLVATLTQLGTWGLWVGVFLGMAVVAVIAIQVGARWHRAGAATVACIFGFVALMFAGLAVSESYLRIAGEPEPATVLEVYESGDVRHCVVAEIADTDTVHDLEPRQNCYSHIEQGERVTITKDPLGVLPPLLEEGPDQTPLSTEVGVSAALVVLTSSAVLYGGLRRRAAPPPSAPQLSAVSENGLKRLGDGEDIPVPHALWIDRRGTPIMAGRGRQPQPTDDAGPARWQIGVTDAAVPAERTFYRLLAFPEPESSSGHRTENDRTARRRGSRRFVLWADPGRGDVYARVTTSVAARRRTARYEVLDADGETLATVERRPGRVLLPRRTRWTVQQNGHEPVVGRKGRLAWWAVWWLTLPLQIVLVAFFVVTWIVSFFSADGIGPIRPPRRTRWRHGGRVVLDYRASYGEADRLEVRTDGWDPRVTAALVALIRSHDGWLGDRWTRDVVANPKRSRARSAS